MTEYSTGSVEPVEPVTEEVAVEPELEDDTDVEDAVADPEL